MLSATIHRFRTITIEQVISAGIRHIKVLTLATAAGGLAGIGISYLKTSQYRVDISLMPELQTRSALSLKRFGALAELAGLSIDGDGGITEAIRPDLYSNILESDTFRYEALRHPVTTIAGQHYSSLVAFLTDPSRSWLAGLTGSQTISTFPPIARQLTLAEENILLAISHQIMADMDKQSGMIQVRVDLPDPAVAQQIAAFSIRFLKAYVTAYRTAKLRQTLAFLNSQQQQAHQRYQLHKKALASYQDSHRNLFLQSATLDGDQLENEAAVAGNVFQRLTEEFEHTRLLIQEQMPVLQVLSPPRPPSRRSSPSRILHGLTGGLLSTLLAFITLVCRDVITQKS
ncbi:hypothetical protein [Arsenicibacter rosenii]|uniref:Lipopolysaccharide biosynthesis protein n=1 Tax=Arsenicibacter rosenii TaxID=1750698 RepID=A0A1S2VNE3_9BACT|nr:hypothetical protein [Arsenicibacter rosenii]OIN60283.1 hypothetical protein BLX24_05480 [Arsenicibacter rosenii]